MRHVVMIEEEYGYARWIARLDDRELEEAKRRWKSMRGLNCLVPVTLVFPQARISSRKEWYELVTKGEAIAAKKDPKNPYDKYPWLYAHVNQADDSFFDALPGYKVPAAGVFEMDGRQYSEDELCELLDGQRRRLGPRNVN